MKNLLEFNKTSRKTEDMLTGNRLLIELLNNLQLIVKMMMMKTNQKITLLLPIPVKNWLVIMKMVIPFSILF